MSNITQVVNTDKNMTHLKKAMRASDLDQLWSSRGPFTLFAPVDLAFGKLEAGALDGLLQPESKAALTTLLNQHVIAGKVSFRELKDGDTLTTLGGRELQVKIVDGKTSVNGAVIQSRDLASSNGVIHSLDKVIMN